MKKVLIVFMGLIIGLYLLNEREYNISKDMIRFRVIANSNNSRDIIMKELVVKELSDILFINMEDIEDTRSTIYNNMEIINNKIERLFKKYNYNKTYNIVYGLNEFPKKKFLGSIYPAGTYESLVIEIGEAKGDNYFCILYPSLCMIDYEKNDNKEEKFKFKIIEVFENLF